MRNYLTYKIFYDSIKSGGEIMAIYYHKLWALMREKQINQKQLSEKTGISTATIFQMKRNEYVSLAVLDRIATFLQCDYKDIITNVNLVEENRGGYQRIINLCKSRSIVYEALNEYMKENELSINDVLEITTLSLNTLKKFLRGENLSQNSYYKMLRLGEEFRNLIKEKCGGNIFSFL